MESWATDLHGTQPSDNFFSIGDGHAGLELTLRRRDAIHSGREKSLSSSNEVRDEPPSSST